MKIKSRGDAAWSVAANIVMIVLSLCAFLPFWLLIAASFTEEHTAVRLGYKFIPSQFSTAAYDYILKQWAQIGRSLTTIYPTF